MTGLGDRLRSRPRPSRPPPFPSSPFPSSPFPSSPFPSSSAAFARACRLARQSTKDTNLCAACAETRSNSGARLASVESAMMDAYASSGDVVGDDAFAARASVATASEPTVVSLS